MNDIYSFRLYNCFKLYFFPFTFAFICDTTTQTQGDNFGEYLII